MPSGFLRHLRACNNARLPGGRIAFFIGTSQVGWLKPAVADALRGFPGVTPLGDGLSLTDPDSLPNIAKTLAERGFYRFRREAFDVRATPEGPALAQIDRGALPSFGVQAVGVHVNGLVTTPGGMHLWVARRARDKLLDPGKLDHIVAGGVPAALTPDETLVKEAAEEAAIPRSLAAQARHVATIGYAMERPEGLRRDILHCYDLHLPSDFRPHAADGEVEEFALWPLQRVADTVAAGDEFKFNVNLVLIDLFIRRGLVAEAQIAPLRAELTGLAG